jgi:hypothetical protein
MIFRLRQPERELRESKGKLMKGNESKIPFISFHKFFRIQTFQRVMAEKIKNLSRAAPRAPGCALGGFSNSRERFPPGQRSA